ncbi:TetR/AcrR family transcriptional regulator [Chryseosolibacter indicus]|uniref:TetR/AcrR family transcriptional regulator n=1 Tax=Chryseosolibacter indicus TaxID=2782351 RepID=A0ABS5VNB2_9BACT|nr:TetR/AcrR family transcriptional regulator [Chryseosolibacter indicus]MBT1702611.1 TetR/AcrR family transcriptional regulator [Chryseosolibacter indicus]
MNCPFQNTYLPPMPRNVEFNEEEAIQKAMEVFWEKGYNATSLRDLTDAMKINSSSLYNTIGDKQELFVRCVKHYTDIRKRDLQKRLASSKSPFTILVDYINDAVDVIISGDNSCMAVKTAFEVATNDQRVKDILKEDSGSAYQFLYTLIKKAIEEGEISPEEDAEVLADYFISTWTGWYESYILHKDPIKIRKMAQYFIKQISK